MPSLKRTKNVSEIPSGIKYTAKALQALSTTLTVAFAKTLFTTPIKYKLPKHLLEENFFMNQLCRLQISEKQFKEAHISQLAKLHDNYS